MTHNKTSYNRMYFQHEVLRSGKRFSSVPKLQPRY